MNDEYEDEESILQQIFVTPYSGTYRRQAHYQKIEQEEEQTIVELSDLSFKNMDKSYRH